MRATHNKPLMGIKRATVSVLLTTGAIVLSSTSPAVADEVTFGDRLGPGHVTERWERAAEHWDALHSQKAGNDAQVRWCERTDNIGFVGDTIGFALSRTAGYASWGREAYCKVIIGAFAYQTNKAIEEYRPVYEGALADLRKYNCGK